MNKEEAEEGLTVKVTKDLEKTFLKNQLIITINREKTFIIVRYKLRKKLSVLEQHILLEEIVAVWCSNYSEKKILKYCPRFFTCRPDPPRSFLSSPTTPYLHN